MVFVITNANNLGRTPERQLSTTHTVIPMAMLTSVVLKITCLYDMDIPKPEHFNETYLYEGKTCTLHVKHSQADICSKSSWSATLLPSSGLASR